MPANFDSGVADVLIRSRQTILQILEDRGYDTTQYRNIAPDQILTLTETRPRALDIFVPKRPDSAAPAERAVVVYEIQARIRMRLDGTYRDSLYTSVDGSEMLQIRPTDDVIVIMNESFHEAFTKFSLRLWRESKARVTFFHIKEIVIYHAHHILVPPHRIMSEEEVTQLMADKHIEKKDQLHIIKMSDMQARILGLVPGDVVEILRSSPSAGIEICYRACFP